MIIDNYQLIRISFYGLSVVFLAGALIVFVVIL